MRNNCILWKVVVADELFQQPGRAVEKAHIEEEARI
jgi:hypothetical protein